MCRLSSGHCAVLFLHVGQQTQKSILSIFTMFRHEMRHNVQKDGHTIDKLSRNVVLCPLTAQRRNRGKRSPLSILFLKFSFYNFNNFKNFQLVKHGHAPIGQEDLRCQYGVYLFLYFYIYQQSCPHFGLFHRHKTGPTASLCFAITLELYVFLGILLISVCEVGYCDAVRSCLVLCDL